VETKSQEKTGEGDREASTRRLAEEINKQTKRRERAIKAKKQGEGKLLAAEWWNPLSGKKTREECHSATAKVRKKWEGSRGATTGRKRIRSRHWKDGLTVERKRGKRKALGKAEEGKAGTRHTGNLARAATIWPGACTMDGGGLGKDETGAENYMGRRWSKSEPA